MMSSDYKEKDSVVSLYPISKVTKEEALKPSAKKALDAYEEILEDKKLSNELKDPWE